MCRAHPVSAKLAAVNRKIDRRTLRTRAALLSAFRELVLSRGYAAVAVGHIIRRANIGRSTFYLHFSSKQDLLKHSLASLCTGLVACVDGDFVHQRLVALLQHFREQRYLNGIFFEDPIRSIWVGCLAKLIENKLRVYLVSSHDRRLLPRSLLASTIAEMQIAMIIHWLRYAGSVTPERLAAALLTSTRALLLTSRGLPT
jgi:AcrR family transcriptional regulator